MLRVIVPLTDKQRINKLIGRNIRKERELLGISRLELSNMLGVTASHVGLIERGAKGTTAAMLYRLTKIFGVSFDNFFKEAYITPNESSDKATNIAPFFNSTLDDDDFTTKMYQMEIFDAISSLSVQDLSLFLWVIKSMKS